LHDQCHNDGLRNFWEMMALRRDAGWALIIGFVAAAMTAAGDAPAAVHPIGLDQCARGCGSNPMDGADVAQDGADAIITMTLIGGAARGANDPNPFPLRFDPEATPTVLASGLPSALSANGGTASGAQGGSTYVDFEYVFTHPDQVVGPATFLSVASLTGQLTFGDFLADSNAYFAAQSEALSARFPIEADLSIPNRGPSRRFWTEDSEATQKETTHKKAPPPTFSWTDSSAAPSQ
jgi:hypothetical protein